MPPVMPPVGHGNGEELEIHDKIHLTTAIIVAGIIGGTPVPTTGTWNLDPKKGPIDQDLWKYVTASVELHKIIYAWQKDARSDPSWDPTAPKPVPPVPAPAPATVADMVGALTGK